MSTIKCLFCLNLSSDKDEDKKIVTKKSRKRVKFNDDVQIVYIERELVLPGVSWMTMARDRKRFEKRIREIEGAISWIFTPKHRRNIRKMLAFLATSQNIIKNSQRITKDERRPSQATGDKQQATATAFSDNHRATAAAAGGGGRRRAAAGGGERC